MKIIYLLFFVSLVCCSTNASLKDEKRDSFITIDIESALLDDLSSSNFLLSDVVSDLEFVKLELTNRSMIRDIRNILIGDKYILVDDYTEGALLFFKNGKFVSKIGEKGQGPKEYLYIWQAILDEKRGEVVLYTDNGFKVYDLNGEYKRIIPNVKREDLFYSYEHKIILWKDHWFLNEKLPVVEKTKEDLWTFAIVDTLFTMKKKYNNPSLKGQTTNIIANKAPLNGWKNYWLEYFASLDFYGGDFKMKYYDGDTIYKFNVVDSLFHPEYVLELGDHPSFETSHRWIKDTEFFKYLWAYDFFESAQYMYIVVCRSNYLYNVRFDKFTGGIVIVKSENIVNEKVLIGSPGYILRNRHTDFELVNDISGGIPFITRYKSTCGKYWIDEIKPSDLIDKVDIDGLKKAVVTNMTCREKLLNLLKNLDEDDNPILVIATLK